MPENLRSRLAELALELPTVPLPHGEYVPVIVHNGIAYVSGQLSREGDEVVCGPVDNGTSVEKIRRAACACVSRALAALDAHAGGIERIERILFLRGFVYADTTFQRHSRVLDEASRLLHEIFGHAGVHARTAVGVSGLPDNGLLEIEVVVALKEPDN